MQGKRGEAMVVYTPFWNTLRSSGESTYTLIKNHHISSSTIDKLRHNKPLNTTTVNDLCRILSCKVEDILLYIPSDDDQIL
ncbi:helix-turn-helix domain-containing protein [Hominenteromicrobium sp.]|uniref:helix-turn-helix domain-containing protein n=1 Tax=Hominenteromicrobium sp. TaxID=3073581 RepID=UPI003AF16DE6